MPSITTELAAGLRDALQLRRAVETGTYTGDGARRLAASFPEVVTIELSAALHVSAARNLADLATVRCVQGDSTDWLPQLVDAAVPTLWFLDGHYSAGTTAGQDDQCPVLREIAALRGGNENDAIVVDDARMFLVSPEPPQDPSQWPTLLEVTDALRAVAPGHHITLIDDQLIAVPPHARPSLDRYARSIEASPRRSRRSVRRWARRLLGRVG